MRRTQSRPPASDRLENGLMCSREQGYRYRPICSVSSPTLTIYRISFGTTERVRSPDVPFYAVD